MLCSFGSIETGAAAWDPRKMHLERVWEEPFAVDTKPASSGRPAYWGLVVFLSVCLSVEMSRTLPSLGFPISTVAKGATHRRNGIPARRSVKYCSLKNTFTGILLQLTIVYKRLTRSKFIIDSCLVPDLVPNHSKLSIALTFLVHMPCHISAPKIPCPNTCSFQSDPPQRP